MISSESISLSIKTSLANLILLNYLIPIILLFFSSSLYSQSVKQDKMEALSFMVGEWIGTTTVIENGVIAKEGAAFQRINFDMDKHILVIELNSEFLQLRTIVNYDEEEQTYYYHPFSKSGSGKYAAKLVAGQLIVSPNDHTRYVFAKTGERTFREHGEQLKDGVWVKTFEDNFTASN